MSPMPRQSESGPLMIAARPRVHNGAARARFETTVRRSSKKSRHPNYRLLKIHRSYTVEKIAQLLDVHKNTVRNWFKQGLPAIDRQRPTLILGSILSRFLRDRRQRGRWRCAPGEIYCVKCRVPVQPAGDMAEYLAKTSTWGVLRGICPACESLIHRLVSWARLDDSRGSLEITISQARLHIIDSRSFSANCDSNGGG